MGLKSFPLQQLEQLAELLRPYTRPNETIFETVLRLIRFHDQKVADKQERIA